MAIEVFNRYENKYLLDGDTFEKLQSGLCQSMGLDTHRITSSLGPKGGDMQIDYIVDFDHAMVGRNSFHINVKEQGGIN